MNEEKYLETIEQIIADPDAFGLPALAPVVAMWLRDYRPGNPEQRHEFDHSSQEIAEDLRDVAQLGTNEIALVMVAAGYRIRRYIGGALWSMEYAGTYDDKDEDADADDFPELDEEE